MKNAPLAISIILAGIALVAGAALILYEGSSSMVQDIAGQGSAASTTAGVTGIIGNRLPLFDLPDLAGNRVRSSDFLGIPLIIVFWSTENASSADEIHLIDQYLSSGIPESAIVKMVAIDNLEDKSIVESFMHRGGYTVETLLDTQGVAGERYNVKGLPTFYFIDKDGVVRGIYAGMLNQSGLINKVDALLGGDAVQ